MADQNDNDKNDLVGLPDFHDKNEDAASPNWRDLLHDHLKEAVGKTYSFDLPRSDRGLYALKPSAFAATSEEAQRVYDELMALPAMTVVFEHGEITPAFYEGKGGGGTDLSAMFDHLPPPTHVITSSDDGVTIETAREHNERKYPDLMKRLDRLANRPLDSDDDK
jgi:hypothetical protein